MLFRDDNCILSNNCAIIDNCNMASKDYDTTSSDNMLAEEGKRNTLVNRTIEMNISETDNSHKCVDLDTPSATMKNHRQINTDDYVYDEAHLLGSEPAVDLLIEDMDESLLNTPSKGVALSITGEPMQIDNFDVQGDHMSVDNVPLRVTPRENNSVEYDSKKGLVKLFRIHTTPTHHGRNSCTTRESK